MKGNIHSLEPFGSFDGPGFRMVVFFQGCGWQCIYCHNRDTWSNLPNKLMSVEEILAVYHRYASFYQRGGITLSGGEPLLQLDFCLELLRACKKENIHTCVDTSAQNFNPNNLDKYQKLISLVDLFLLDIKQINPSLHYFITKNSGQCALDFLDFLALHQRPVIIRYVLIPPYSSDLSDLYALRKHLDKYNNILDVDVLSFHLLGSDKWEKLGYHFTLQASNIPSKEMLQTAIDILKNK
ncbi:MAG: pyruvate formate lyase-activating protein [Acholeplasmatales bacterium]|jgi:pyruvate formate lyase activating enzyme|nr:pyruvate formate lyase-activating protein [Acholeplasmatales bacterium]